MAQKDNVMDEDERLFIEDLLTVTKIDGFEQINLDDPVEEDIEKLSNLLSSKKARKAFLLTLATVALADGSLDDAELTFLSDLTKRLKVGRVKIKTLDFNQGKNLVLKMLAKCWPLKDESSDLSHKQPTDMDMQY